MSTILRLIGGPQAGPVLTITPGRPLVVGRDPACGLRLSGAAVSRQHARFTCTDGELVVERISKSNGLFVNGLDQQQASLGLWDTVVIGNHVLRVDALGGIHIPEPVEVGPDASLLACLLEILGILSSADEQLVERSLDALFLALPATRLSLFTVGPEGEPVQGHTVVRSGLPTTHMSQGFARQVLAAGKAVLLEVDATTDGAVWGRTLREQAVHTVIGMPVMRNGKAVGVLLADNLEQPGTLDRTHLAVLGAVARSLEHVFQRQEFHALSQQRMRAQAEFEAAQAVQRVLIARDPARLPGPWTWAAHCRPALELGGDFYDVHHTDEAISWIVADVSGKGLPAALVVSMLRIACKELQPRRMLPHEFLLGLDHLLRGEMPGFMFVTAIAATIHRDGRLEWSGIGHPDGLIRRADGSIDRLPSTQGMIGLMPVAALQKRTISRNAQLYPGDRLCLLSDGVAEAMDPHNNFLPAGIVPEALRIAGPPPDVINGLLEAIDRHRDTAPQADDITLVVGDFHG